MIVDIVSLRLQKSPIYEGTGGQSMYFRTKEDRCKA